MRATLRIFKRHTLVLATLNPSQIAPGLFISICNTLVSLTSISVAPKAWKIFGAQCSHSFRAVLVAELSKCISYPMFAVAYFLAQDIQGIIWHPFVLYSFYCRVMHWFAGDFFLVSEVPYCLGQFLSIANYRCHWLCYFLLEHC